ARGEERDEEYLALRLRDRIVHRELRAADGGAERHERRAQHRRRPAEESGLSEGRVRDEERAEDDEGSEDPHAGRIQREIGETQTPGVRRRGGPPSRRSRSVG